MKSDYTCYGLDLTTTLSSINHQPSPYTITIVIDLTNVIIDSTNANVESTNVVELIRHQPSPLPYPINVASDSTIVAIELINHHHYCHQQPIKD